MLPPVLLRYRLRRMKSERENAQVRRLIGHFTYSSFSHLLSKHNKYSNGKTTLTIGLTAIEDRPIMESEQEKSEKLEALNFRDQRKA